MSERYQLKGIQTNEEGHNLALDISTSEGGEITFATTEFQKRQSSLPKERQAEVLLASVPEFADLEAAMELFHQLPEDDIRAHTVYEEKSSRAA